MNQIAVKQYHRKHVNYFLICGDQPSDTIHHESTWKPTGRDDSSSQSTWLQDHLLIGKKIEIILDFLSPLLMARLQFNWELSDVSKGRKQIRKTLDFYLENYLLFSFSMKLKIPPNVLRYREFHRIIPRRAKKRLRIVGYSNESHVCTKTIQLVLKHHNSLDNSCVT